MIVTEVTFTEWIEAYFEFMFQLNEGVRDD
jgi:hypothetical protein